MNIYKLLPSLESPPYGEALEAGELFLDGTEDYTSSDGRKSPGAVVDYEPSIEIVDGVEVQSVNSKWPGKKGTYGFFGEYTNDANDDSFVASGVNAELSKEGDWLKVFASTGGTSVTIGGIATFPTTFTTVGYFRGYVRRGNTDESYISTGGAGRCSVLWDTKSFLIDQGTDLNSHYISDEIFYFSFLGLVGATALQIYARNYASTATGDYSYYKDVMAVDLGYPVPYTPGVHQANKMPVDFDWSISDSWTIEGKAVLIQDPVADYQRVFTLGFAEGSYNYCYFDINKTTGEYRLVSYLDGVLGTSEGVSAQQGVLFNWKIVFQSTAYMHLHVDGVIVCSLSAQIPAVSNIPKTASIGFGLNAGVYSSPFNGYIQDLSIQPAIDTSHDHFNSGLPWYDPNKAYGDGALWSIGKYGQIAGDYQEAGRVVYDEVLPFDDGTNVGAQHITKWDTGHMTIGMQWDVTVDITQAADQHFYRLTGTTLFLEEFLEPPTGSAECTGSGFLKAELYSTTTTGVRTIVSRDVSSAGNLAKLHCLLVGRWK